MRKGTTALAAVLALALSLTACGKKPPEQFEIEVQGPEHGSDRPVASSAVQSAPAEGGIQWAVEPRQDLEIERSLADHAHMEKLPNQSQLAFFGQAGGFGVIDLEGNILVPASENVRWCSLCGITNQDESKIFDDTGAVTGSGGHGGWMLDLCYDVEHKQLYRDEMDVLAPVETVQNDAVQAVRCVTLVDIQDEFSGWALDHWDSGRRVDTEWTGQWGLLGRDGRLLCDGAQFDDVYGVLDPRDGVPLMAEPVKEGMVAVKQKGMWSFLWEDGRPGPGPYEEVRPFEDGVAAVKTPEGWGFIDRSGKALTPMNFLGAASASRGRAWVKTQDGWGVIVLGENPA